MTIRTLCSTAALAALVAGLAMPAHAQLDFNGHWYIQGGGGLNWANDQGWHFFYGDDVPIGFLGGDISYDLGWLAGGAVGYALDSGFRLEVEGMYRSNDVDEISICDLEGGMCGAFAAEASADVISIMFNILYDVDTGTALTPYLGGGVGAGNVDYAGGGLSEDVWGVGLQAIAGVSYAVTDRVDLFADYRYFTVLGSDVSGGFSNPEEFVDYGIDDDYSAHSLFFGARYHFLPPPPPPPAPVVEAPPPPPAAQDRFIVFFDFDRSNLTAQANGVLDNAVAAYNSGGFAQVLAEAHTDRAGSNQYNEGLSQRRGESVRQGLIARGVAPDEIVVRAFGETVNLVPTPDGVREPQNRRVEIILM